MICGLVDGESTFHQLIDYANGLSLKANGERFAVLNITISHMEKL
jgi:hypothetical protein